MIGRKHFFAVMLALAALIGRVKANDDSVSKIPFLCCTAYLGPELELFVAFVHATAECDSSNHFYPPLITVHLCE